jgi:hypothetical protein
MMLLVDTNKSGFNYGIIRQQGVDLATNELLTVEGVLKVTTA